MRGGRSGKSHAIGWTLAIIAVPVLYLLSVLPIYYIMGYNDFGKRESKWFTVYAYPCRELSRNPLVRRPLDIYGEWLKDRFVR